MSFPNCTPVVPDCSLVFCRDARLSSSYSPTWRLPSRKFSLFLKITNGGRLSADVLILFLSQRGGQLRHRPWHRLRPIKLMESLFSLRSEPQLLHGSLQQPIVPDESYDGTWPHLLGAITPSLHGKDPSRAGISSIGAGLYGLPCSMMTTQLSSPVVH